MLKCTTFSTFIVFNLVISSRNAALSHVPLKEDVKLKASVVFEQFLKGIKRKLNTGWNLQEWVLGLDGHAGFSKGEEEGEEDWSERGFDEVRAVEVEGEKSLSPGLIQNALPWLPLLLVSACWSDRKTSSLLSLCNRSLVSSLSTQRITHSRLLSTFCQIFSWRRKRTLQRTYFQKSNHEGLWMTLPTPPPASLNSWMLCSPSRSIWPVESLDRSSGPHAQCRGWTESLWMRWTPGAQHSVPG